VQFVRPDQVDAMLGNEGSIVPLTEEQIAEQLRTLRRDPSAWHLAAAGQFSLAGAQAKTALHRNPDSGVWGDPSGAVPTTHIVKPAIVGFDDHDLNEHLCLSAARIAGLRAAVSSVQSFAGERAIVVHRYDRRPTGSGDVRRVHQEDMREAVTPRAAATLEVNRFVDALALGRVRRPERPRPGRRQGANRRPGKATARGVPAGGRDRAGTRAEIGPTRPPGRKNR
jgi:hypothetical protein